MGWKGDRNLQSHFSCIWCMSHSDFELMLPLCYVWLPTLNFAVKVYSFKIIRKHSLLSVSVFSNFWLSLEKTQVNRAKSGYFSVLEVTLVMACTSYAGYQKYLTLGWKTQPKPLSSYFLPAFVLSALTEVIHINLI